MSVRCISRVFDESVHGGTQLLMLLALADFSDDKGNSYPAVDALAQKCRIKPRWVQYVLRTLVASGELLILKNQGPHGTNKYQLVLKPQSANEGVHCGAGCTVVQGALQQPKGVHSDAALTNQNEPSVGEGLFVPSRKPLVLKDLVAEGVDAAVAKDWLAVRKAKRAPLTPTAWNAIKHEAELAHITPAEAVKVAAENGWQGFKAVWLQHRANGPADDVFSKAI